MDKKSAWEKLFEEIKESPEKAITSARNYLDGFYDKKIIKDSGILRVNDFYSGRYRLTNWISKHDNDAVLSVYDEEKWCSNKDCGCEESSNNIQLAALSEYSLRELIKKDLKGKNILMHALTRNLNLGFRGFNTFLDTQREMKYNIHGSRLLKETSTISAQEGVYIRTRSIPYEEARNLIKEFRK